MIFPNLAMGSIVYRTREALNENDQFMKALKEYAYNASCIHNGNFLLWHLPGTHMEISQVLRKLGEASKGSQLKFPSVLNYQSVQDSFSDNERYFRYNLAIVGVVDSKWTTEQRQHQTWRLLLAPIAEELIRQIRMSGYFVGASRRLDYTRYMVSTTGYDVNTLLKRYGDNIDAAEYHGMQLQVRDDLCESDLARMEEEAYKVSDYMNEILKGGHCSY